MTTAMADNDSGRQRRRQMMTARKIERRITRGKEESGWQTTTALGQPGRERETKIKKSSLRKKTFFRNTVCPVGVFAPAKNQLSSFSNYQSYVFAFCACGRGRVLSRNLLAGKVGFCVFVFPETKPVDMTLV